MKGKKRDLIAAQAARGVKGGFLVVVNYARTFQQMITDSLCTPALELESESYRPRGRGKVQRELILVHLGLDATTDQVVGELGERHLEPAKAEDLLAFAATHFCLEHKFAIVALGTPFDRRGEREFLIVENNGIETRALKLGAPRRGQWDSSYRFLALRKKGWLDFLKR